ncbi:hypothetical protein [Planctomyces sp. SH-PL62]|uniref:hypothetical protein n=1 Tax=Planctomyces sp. SH-PL62 TaxID=1636152 RepID=UPI00078E43F4|nr:hypothetical protein [Planctomyces sp. SH-PL62]AMV39449.1 hypothetical protein VT85_18570 [Planctomyces sp. SH-PL62]
MGRLEAISQFIVPLIFLAIWALTSLLNREGQPLPQRPARPGGRPGPNALGPAARREETAGIRDGESPAPSASRRSTADLGSEEGGAWTPDRVPRPSPSSAPTPPRRIGRQAAADGQPAADVYVIDDELVFIDPVSRMQIGSAPVSGPRSSPRPAAARKPSRSRRQEPRGERPLGEDPATQRVLSEQVGQSMALNRGKPMDLSPLTSKLTALGDTSLRNASSAAATVASNVVPPSLTAQELSRMIADQPRLREMALIAEVLQPPVSLRRSRRGV